MNELLKLLKALAEIFKGSTTEAQLKTSQCLLISNVEMTNKIPKLHKESDKPNLESMSAYTLLTMPLVLT